MNDAKIVDWKAKALDAITCPACRDATERFLEGRDARPEIKVLECAHCHNIQRRP